MEKKLYILLFVFTLLFLFLFLISSSINDDIEKHNLMVVEDGFFNYTYGYNSTTGVMTNWDSLSYSVYDNGIIEVKKDKTTQNYFSFALTGTVSGVDYIYTAEDFTWTWTHNQNGDNHSFSAYNNNPDFNWTQRYYFYPNQSMKIKHILTNDLGDIENTKMWYLHTIDDEEKIIFNDTEYELNLTQDKHFQGNFNDILPKVDIKSKYFFNYSDLVKNNFNITDIFLGNGSIIEHPEVYIMAVGFTKNNGFFPKGARVEIDPTIETVESTNDVGWFSSTALSSIGEVRIAYKDETNNDLRFCNGTSGSWTCEKVISENLNDLSIAIDGNDQTHIVFRNGSNMLAHCEGNFNSWSCEIIDNSDYFSGQYISMDIDKNNNIHVSGERFSSKDDGLDYANGTFGSWQLEHLGGGSGTRSSSLIINSTNNVHIITRQYHLYSNSGTWSTESISSIDQGSLNVDSNDELHYCAYVNTDLNYCYGTTGSWTCETIDSEGDVGKSCSIDVSFNNKIFISYYDATNDNLKICEGTAGSWTCEKVADVDGNDLGGTNRALVIKKGRRIDMNSFSDSAHISWYSNSDLMYTIFKITCEYSGSGNWELNLSNNCVLSENKDIYPNNLIVVGDNGSLTINSTITTKSFHFTPDDFNGDSIVKIIPGGQLIRKP